MLNMQNLEGCPRCQLVEDVGDVRLPKTLLKVVFNSSMLPEWSQIVHMQHAVTRLDALNWDSQMVCPPSKLFGKEGYATMQLYVGASKWLPTLRALWQKGLCNNARLIIGIWNALTMQVSC